MLWTPSVVVSIWIGNAQGFFKNHIHEYTQNSTKSAGPLSRGNSCVQFISTPHILRAYAKCS